MPSYDQWNHALLTYFTQGVPRGASVFLNVDDDALYRIGLDLLDASSTSSDSLEHSAQLRLPLASSDPRQLPLPSHKITSADTTRAFCHAVRQRTMWKPSRVTLSGLSERNAQGEPTGVAFLCSMVLAASRMAEEEDLSSTNYFKRFRDILELPGSARPNGMEYGAEKVLWEEWARWLQEHDYIPTAHAGKGRDIYIGYPISQTLLRRTDKEKLEKLFADKHWIDAWDIEMLAYRVQRESGYLPQHLRELLGSGEQRFHAIAEAIYDVYDAWIADPHPNQLRRVHVGSANLLAGLYRVEDPFLGDVAYHVYPRQPRRRGASRIVVAVSGVERALVPDRPGWYEPISRVDDVQLSQGARYNIEQPADLESLILPSRQFWLLVPDPEDPDSGIYASWQSPTLGTHFILLCQSSLLPQLEGMRRNKLIAWDGLPVKITHYSGWIEIQDCMVVSETWPDAVADHRDLYESLRPRVSLSVSLSGGLRAPGQVGWIDGHGPQITVIGFNPTVDVSVVNSASEQVVVEETPRLNEPFSVDWPGPGTYRIEANSNGDSAAPRLVKIVSWQDLRGATLESREMIWVCFI